MAIDRAEVAERVTKVVCEVLGVDPADVKEECQFVSDLGAESIQSIELVTAFEDEFDIEMDEDAALQVETVGTAIDFILKHIEEAG